jgi:hypothetical protein
MLAQYCTLFLFFLFFFFFCITHIGNSQNLILSAPSAINLEFSQVKFEEEKRDWIDESLPNRSATNHR